MPVSGTERAHLRFALALHRATAGTGDACFSPYSVASALGLVAAAARGAASEEVSTLLAGEPGQVSAQATLLRDAAELTARTGQDEPVLAVSNTLWAWDQLPLRPDYVAELATWPAGGVSGAPFVEDPEGARALINGDIAKATRDLIPELLSPGTIGADTVASIVNALYLRVAWTSPFQESGTADADFHPPSGTRRVPTMRQSERLGYAEHAGWRLVALPAVGGVEAVVLLPDGPLANAESTLDSDVLAELLSSRRQTMVNLALPKLSLDVRTGLRSALRSLGVRTMFTPPADFSGLTADPRLYVSDVLHEAVLRVDESGLEGAAATAVMMRLVSMPAGDPVTVEVDRPFLFLVRHADTGAVYFLARVVEP
ncbi:serpin family protein [Prauserella cavernicola]|uniref:Serpin family protein n=1 Tax=Prauserella cavernicola TaxID=2800127 RepID=A0A934QQX2_9PSEU|nr:serpin family protein [Prauserella cavernicola]MBK1786577.1 serpin family protein [Prauserella cavernicola]